MRDVEVATVLSGAVILECDFAASNPPPQVTWFADDVMVQEVTANNALLFLNGGRYLYIQVLTAEQRIMRYHCSVSNSLYPNPTPMRAPTTYTLTRDLPPDGSVTVYKELGSMAGAVGEELDFIYVAAARGNNNLTTPLGVSCLVRNPLVTLTEREPIVTAILTNAVTDEEQVNFTCQFFRPGFSQDITGTIIISSEDQLVLRLSSLYCYYNCAFMRKACNF